MRNASRGGKKGFTLIELLVVITVIAILAALLLPALERAMDRVKIAKCTSKLKQLGIAFEMYMGDYGVYPPHGEETQQPWDKALYPYYKNWKLLFCEGDPWTELWLGEPVELGNLKNRGEAFMDKAEPMGVVKVAHRSWAINESIAGKMVKKGSQRRICLAPFTDVLVLSGDVATMDGFAARMAYCTYDRLTGGQYNGDMGLAIGGFTELHPKFEATYDPQAYESLCGAKCPNSPTSENWTKDGDCTPFGEGMMCRKAADGGNEYLFCDGHVEYLVNIPRDVDTADERVYYWQEG